MCIRDSSTDSGSIVLGEVNKGQRVQVLRVKNDWKQIEAPADLKIWIPSTRLQPADDPDRWEKDWRAALKTVTEG